ncbi:bestrophin family protein [Schlesneria sp. DSM 10557]|uniref:bestrophin family protein n=1 Tax=Schlesneria sp. DSM 10557 TaxID=3044399 RepID=UPI0035A00156
MTIRDSRKFWREAFTWHGSVTPLVMPNVLLFGLFATLVCLLAWLEERYYQVEVGLEIAPFEIAGAALGLLLILRTNAGHDRWWEARKLWGGIVNQSRNVVISALSYGPDDIVWRKRFVRWAAAFPHVARCQLRGEPMPPEITDLVGQNTAEQIGASVHPPSYVAMQMATLLREAYESGQMDRFAFMQIDRERATLIDHIGACERILKTPLPKVYAIKIRRFLALFLLTLPFALLHRMSGAWLVPVITMMVAYPLMALDQIGIELQNPFAKANLSHLPIGDISANIEKNLLGFLREKEEGAIDEELHQRLSLHP